jgi:hypothetical protein
MNPVSMITARWVKVNGVPAQDEIPNAMMIQAFCFDEFGQVPSEAVALKVCNTLDALAREWKENIIGGM